MPIETYCNKMVARDVVIWEKVPYTMRVMSCRSRTNRQCRFSSFPSCPSLDNLNVREPLNDENDIKLKDSERASVVSCGRQGTTTPRTKDLEETGRFHKVILDVNMEQYPSESSFDLIENRLPSLMTTDEESEYDIPGRRIGEIRIPSTKEVDQISGYFLGRGRITGVQSICRETEISGTQSNSPVSPSLPKLIPAEEASSTLSQDCRMSPPLQSEEKHSKDRQRTSDHRSGSINARWLFKPWSLEVIFLSLTLLCIAPVSGGFDRGGFQHQITWGRGNSPPGSAVFGNSPTNVTAVLGHRARLPCQVKNLGLKDVSWIRQRDLHILTVGIFTYTSDDRFKVFHPHETEDWYLDISSVTFRDSGTYECQVSTSPKVSLPIYLTVLGVQEADIPGPDEVFIQHGSTISLQCEVQAGVEAVGPVHWLKGADTLNYSSPRGGISMEVEKTPTKTMSKLYITRAVRADSGNYTCAPLFAKPDSVMVHVVNAGEESAAAVHSGSNHCQHEESFFIWAAALLPFTWICLNFSATIRFDVRP